MSNKQGTFIIYALGIFFSYFCFGIMQEKITKGKYVRQIENTDGEVTEVQEKYTYALSLVFAQCFVSYLFSKILLQVKPHGEDKTPVRYYMMTALTYLLAMVSSNMALQWVSYPTQVVGKSAKPIPVLILGVLLGKRSYPLKKYLFVLLVVIGASMFLYKDKTSIQTEDYFGIGEILLILSLTMDGLTGAVQELTRTAAKPSGPQMMYATNTWSCLYLIAALLLTGELFSFSAFIQHFPHVIFELILLAIAGAVGQLFIYRTVSEFGPLPVSIVTTTRKFFTVLASAIIFENTLSLRQWFGTIIVFSGLFLDVYYSHLSKKANDK